MNKHIYRHTILCLIMLGINIQASKTPTPPPAGAPTSSNLNSFLFTVATGVTVILVSKGCEHVMSIASGSKELQKEELKLQKEHAEQKRMALIHEFCKDPAYHDTCQQLKQQYLEAQLAFNKK